MSKKEIQKLPPNARMPVKIKILELNGDYSGWQVKARVNPTIEQVGNIGSGDIDTTRKALANILYEWNFVDEEGNPLNEPSEETTQKLPLDLVNAISTKIVEEITNLPKG